MSVVALGSPRHDLQRLVDAIKSAVYENGAGLSVTEAIGALELAKHEILQEQDKYRNQALAAFSAFVPGSDSEDTDFGSHVMEPDQPPKTAIASS